MDNETRKIINEVEKEYFKIHGEGITDHDYMIVSEICRILKGRLIKFDEKEIERTVNADMTDMESDFTLRAMEVWYDI